jgi:DNA (cytosine-5)-methyltransferase 1
LFVLDLFSGIGGFSLGLEAAGMKTVAFCEQDKFCQKILARHWPTLPIHSDITELNGYEYRGTVELVCGGFPCQPFSISGKQRGAEDDRALWPEMLRVIREVAPRWVIGENVSGIIPMELDTVLSDLEGEGYTCWTFVLPASSVDAPHRRDRAWIVAHANNRQRNSKNQEIRPRRDAPVASGKVVAHAQSKRMEGYRAVRVEEPQASVGKGLSGRDSSGGEPRIWEPEPNVGRMANGIPNRSHRIKALGNAVVPPLVAEIGRIVMEANKTR